ncbi:MAG: DUF1987 domain-containing protein [Bacteroidales bacterium]
MTNLVIQSTDSTPEIEFLLNGILTIKGRSLPEDVHKFYDPLIDWVKQLESEHVVVELKLEYLNTSSTKKLMNLLTAIDQNDKIKTIDVKWHYEFDDLEMEDLGTIYEEDMARAKFQYIEEVDIF